MIAEEVYVADDTEEVSEEELDKIDRFNAVAELLDERILKAVKDMGFEKFSPIQEQAIPYLLEGEDVIGQAQTGTGKTAAFGIPLISRIDPELRKLQAIVLCPTRELAMQAAEEFRKLLKYMHGVKVLAIYGGADISKQIQNLRGVQIIVGTPGRVMDHMRRHTIKLDNVKMVVLDEADEMLNMGFREDMETILGQIEGEHQTALFSATMPKPILEITDRFQKDARMVKVAAKELTIPLVSQRYYKVRNTDKDAASIRLIQYYEPELSLIFCNTKKKVDELAEVLKKAGFQAEGLHGDLSQRQRDVAMNRFRNGASNILIATDVAARGIDVDDVEAVINYDIPQDIEYYVHRIGRTGRAGRSGRSFTLVSAREMYKIRDIERACHTKIEERKLPTAAKVLKVRAGSLMEESFEKVNASDDDIIKKYIYAYMEKNECDAIDVAAALLKSALGEIGEDIPEDNYRAGNRDFGRGRGGRNSYGRGDSYRGERRYGRDGRDGRGRDGRDGRDRGRSFDRDFNKGRRSDRDFDKKKVSGDNRPDRPYEERRPTRVKELRRDGSIAFKLPKRRKNDRKG
ncbi:MAG: DEAD/DEAH box helicase [Lachnospiraceae bacterium]|nr:DEAD/DEAH box helicase [Lachnospiraceae bacterium]